MTVLRGPADADHFRVRVGRYGDRFYADPLPGDDIAEATDESWPSVTTIKKASGSDWSYVAMKRIAQAGSGRLAVIASKPFDERYEELKSINKLGLERAGARGTQVHRWLEQALRGEKIALEPDGFEFPGSNYFAAVNNFLDTYQPELVAAEMVCIHRGLGYGGTADAYVMIDGKLYIVDWKSRGEDSDHGAYPEEAAQLGGYAFAEYMIVEGSDGPKRMQMPNTLDGLIVSIKPDGVRLYPVDLDKASVHFENMLDWWLARHSERDAIGKPWAPRKIAGGASTQLATAEALPALAERRRQTVNRVTALNAEGRNYLAAHWPDVPTLKASEMHSDAEFDLIEAAIDEAEKETEAPFNPPPIEKLASRYMIIEGGPEFFDEEGPDVTAEDVAAARALYEEQKLALDAWARQVHDDGLRSLNLRQRPSLWRWTVITSLAHAAREGFDDEGLREIIFAATGREHCLMISIPLGAVIASLTIKEAERLGELIRAFGAGFLTMTWSDDGVPQFSGPAWNGAA